MASVVLRSGNSLQMKSRVREECLQSSQTKAVCNASRHLQILSRTQAGGFAAEYICCVSSLDNNVTRSFYCVSFNQLSNSIAITVQRVIMTFNGYQTKCMLRLYFMTRPLFCYEKRLCLATCCSVSWFVRNITGHIQCFMLLGMNFRCVVVCCEEWPETTVGLKFYR